MSINKLLTMRGEIQNDLLAAEVESKLKVQAQKRQDLIDQLSVLNRTIEVSKDSGHVFGIIELREKALKLASETLDEIAKLNGNKENP